jgi:pimeloyl-ACP methyl ester carboxylesterase
LQIAGEKDVLVLPQQVQDIADKISHAQIEVLQEMGHDYRKNPEFIQRVNKEIIHFLKEKC